MPGPRPRPFAERFWRYVDQSGGPDACWPWTGHVDSTSGYGKAGPDELGRKGGAHRFAYELTFGPIPDGHVIDYGCHDPATCDLREACPHRRCCNPTHLTATTQKTNRAPQRGGNHNRDKMTCPHDHPYTEANTRVGKDGLRRCITCINARYQARKAASG